MIDIHTHCLPKLDDGAKDVKESLEMLSESYKQGVKKTIATPHCIIHKNEDIDKFILRRNKAHKLLADAESENIPKIFMGAEVYLDNDITKYADVGKLCIENTKYILLELTKELSIERTAEVIYGLTLKGIIPIIAHIDRYPDWKEYIFVFKGLKIIYQVNASRFLSFRGRAFIRKILKYKVDIVVGSDMHNTGSRPCTMKKAYEKAKAKYGTSAEKMFNNEL